MKETYVLFSAGRGPEECCAACQRIFQYFVKQTKIKAAVVNVEYSEYGYRSILLKTEDDVESFRSRWEGTIKYISQYNSIRLHHKRSNWYVKCAFMEFDDESIELDPNDIKIDRMRARGPGGQLVNKVESCVRLTHIPTGISVTCQAERSQTLNIWLGTKLLKLKLSILKDKKMEQKKKEIWLNQIQVERGNEVMTLAGEV